MSFEKICEWHKDPVNAFLHGVSFIIIIIALWNHSVGWIILAIIIMILGHLIQGKHHHRFLGGKKKRK